MAAALILAAGRGERLRPLTDRVPKPLLPVAGKALIEWQVERLAAGGFDDIVVNHAHLGEQIEAALGDGSRFGARIRYSPESPALETAGGIVRALPLLDGAPFAVVSADIHTDFPFASLHARIAALAAGTTAPVAHFVLVDNPSWHAEGDMGLRDGVVTRQKPWLTYGNIAVFQPAPFRALERGAWLKLFPWMYRFVEAGQVTGERYAGAWDNVGTAAQLEDLDRRTRP
ncbi:MAG TPA: nucleotidyltransferase family protein [Usitatibacter sp.]|jgi:MurNAc alpha-1-phosphate uridylyltransferase|nr:nucleotidyltransferase family protein [Usitatibacter sp.]